MKLAVLGSTGEIGKITLKVSENIKGCKVEALLCNNNWKLLGSQVAKYHPKVAVILNEDAYKKAKKSCSLNGTKLANSVEAFIEAIEKHEIDTVVSATIGSSLLQTNYDLLRLRLRLLLANKESIVLAGNILKKEAEMHGSKIIAIDSEHFGIQSIVNKYGRDFKRLFLTASGGPFRNYTKEQLDKVTIEDALKHPIWKMGKRITIDSATMMNKAFEIIEASLLFDVPASKINVLIHPQSIIHALVEYPNEITYAQMSMPSMEIPIKNALLEDSYNNQLNNQSGFSLDLDKIGNLELIPPDPECVALQLAYLCSSKGKSYPVVLNAADEVAVDLFLNKQIKFTDIIRLIEKTVELHKTQNLNNIQDIFEIDSEARLQTASLANKENLCSV